MKDPIATPMQTLVVHREQLTAENLVQLGQAGYSILSDPALLIFGRPAPEAVQEASALPAAPTAAANGKAAVPDELARG